MSIQVEETTEYVVCNKYSLTSRSYAFSLREDARKMKAQLGGKQLGWVIERITRKIVTEEVR
ncbi:hypothetical protein AVT15_gp102 [Pseudomonas phage vB_PaeM_PS24]|uniref:Uncharacterized protein n=1 Tax=Pseudomonas phage vB_PaeM_PS24 TaxID=1542092 RepID=A0A0K0L9I5_9CAUD|nr:hypothetical protein AVT15_gp102 [Pseudomonas phage vB_PaeM_PS24]AIW01804.1 hypothetical protein vB_PaeM_PS2400102 [Pseudomonas phage vB_PaeM_PS24]